MPNVNRMGSNGFPQGLERCIRPTLLEQTPHAVRAATLILALAVGGASSAQNLVPNGSFEEYTECPDNLNQIDRVAGWSLFYGSPDYYNACSETFLTDVPANAFGFQSAFDGESYIGCYTFKTGPVYRECIQAQLLQPLVLGQTTSLSMAVSPGGFGVGGNYDVTMAARGIGMRFSTQPVGIGLLITDEAVLYMDEVLSDTSTWVVLSALYVPDSAYQYIQIGNFFSDELSEPTMLDPNGQTDAAYAFVDAVCVAYDPALCGKAQSVADRFLDRVFRASSPFDQDMKVWLPKASSGRLSLELLDASGRSVWNAVHQGMETSLTLALPELQDGIYLLKLSDQRGSYSPLRVVHQSP